MESHEKTIEELAQEVREKEEAEDWVGADAARAEFWAATTDSHPELRRLIAEIDFPGTPVDICAPIWSAMQNAADTMADQGRKDQMWYAGKNTREFMRHVHGSLLCVLGDTTNEDVLAFYAERGFRP